MKQVDKCDKCDEVAMYHSADIVNDEVTEIHLCQKHSGFTWRKNGE